MKVLTVDYRSPDAAERFTESLRTTGFGVLTHHPIPKELVQSIYDNWYRFFMSEQKQAFLFNRETQDGYFPPSVSEVAKGNSQKDIKEYFHLYPWGQMPEALRAQAMEYYRLANDLAAELLRRHELPRRLLLLQQLAACLFEADALDRGAIGDLLLDQRRQHPAGADGVAGHARLRGLQADRLGQPEQAVLGRHVGRFVDRGDQAVH